MYRIFYESMKYMILIQKILYSYETFFMNIQHSIQNIECSILVWMSLVRKEAISMRIYENSSFMCVLHPYIYCMEYTEPICIRTSAYAYTHHSTHENTLVGSTLLWIYWLYGCNPTCPHNIQYSTIAWERYAGPGILVRNFAKKNHGVLMQRLWRF